MAITEDNLSIISKQVDTIINELEEMNQYGNITISNLIDCIKTESFCLFELAQIQSINYSDITNLNALIQNAKSLITV